jgi:hypothetical protein
LARDETSGLALSVITDAVEPTATPISGYGSRTT